MAGPEQDLAQEQEGGERPWEEPGALRRDYEPHRGRLFVALAWGNVFVLALFAGVLGLAVAAVPAARPLVGAVPLLVGVLPFPLGVLTWALAARDLARIRAGFMDPAGSVQTNAARQLGLAAMAIGAAFALLTLLVVLGLAL
jgi:hypothetical protein